VAQTGKNKFQWPAEGRISSHFGENRGDHVHSGLDIAAPEGTSVKAAAAGKVIKTGFEAGGAGNFVVVDHGGGYTTKYMHLSKIGVREGQTVQAGEEIGKVGNTGKSTGPHLHFQVEKDGNAVDPLPFLNGKPAELNLEEAGNAPVAGGNAPANPAGPAVGGGAAVAAPPARRKAAPGGADPGGAAPGGADPGGAAPGGAAPGGAAPGGAAPAGPAVQLSKATTNLLDLLKQAGIPAELLALLLELLQNGQLDEAQFQDLAKKFLKGDAQVQDLQAMADQAKQNPPKAPPVRDGAAPGAPAGGVDAPNIAGNGNGDAAAKEALTYLGTRYVFGGNGRNGIDCSGLVQQVFKKQGINLPRTADEQAKAGQEVPRDQLKPGDLVYFKGTYKPGVSHIGIYLGNGKFVHAPKTGDVVKVSNLNDAYYQQHWGGARRVT
jgi:cell wall-associated NlpC family hydrolase